jgi:hypothetical protein
MVMMQISFRRVFQLIVILVVFSVVSFCQQTAIEGKLGLSFLTGNGSSTGLLIGGGVDFPFQERLYFRPELNITTHGGTPIEFAANLRYFLPPNSFSTELFVDGGLGIWFYTGGPALGLDAGIGTLLSPSNSNFKIPVELRIGPIFESGSAVFQIALTTGIRLGLP